jgi:hypothetical protein
MKGLKDGSNPARGSLGWSTHEVNTLYI